MARLSRCPFAIPLAVLLALTAAATSRAQSAARFDLTGPKIEVRVTRAGVTLPIASVPNLQPGDRLWVHPNLPPTQSVHYLLVVVFLRGTTNPPPENWFVRIEAWQKKVRDEGSELTVPDEAQQAVMLLAPVTGGDFGTLRSAVQGRPGIFVRASQDLSLAGFEQARIERYLSAMKEVPLADTSDPKLLANHSNTIAATLALKPNPDCMKLAPDQQYTCLTQTGTQTLLDDGHGQNIVAALSSGPGSDFINQASYTQLAGAGVYSAYVGAIVDLVRIMGTLHTAQYQYIPAIAFPQDQALNLRLNVAPSFHNPKSVLVIGLPSIQKIAPPPLRPSNPKLVSCLANPEVVLPVEGAPLVFSTALAHDLVLHINYSSGAKPGPGEPQDIPLIADAYRGGLILAPAEQRRPLPERGAPGLVSETWDSAHPPSGAARPAVSSELTGTIHGLWGFDPFTGPTLALQEHPGRDWKLASDTETQLIAGRDRHIVLASSGTACVQKITLDDLAQPGPGQTGPGQPGAGVAAESESATFKPGLTHPNTIDVALALFPLAAPAQATGMLHLGIRQFGDSKTDIVTLTAYPEPAKLTALEYHAGDTTATLTGSNLDQVAHLELNGAVFSPSARPPGGDSGPSLSLALPSAAHPPKLPAGERLIARVALKDGRTLSVPVVVAAPRLSVALLGKQDIPPEAASRPPLLIHLASDADLPLTHSLMFSLKSSQPFPRKGRIEVASADGSLNAALSVANEALILEDPQTLLGKLEPLKTFGPSAFGQLQVRPVSSDNTPGEWLPLVTLVRLPRLSSLTCPVAPAPDAPAPPDPSPAACTLTGSSLYLIDAVASDAAFTHSTQVPPGFIGSSLAVPAPTGAVYYIRLHDDPAAIDTVTLPAGPLPGY